MDDWKKDPRLRMMNPEKVRLLEHFADRIKHTEKNQLLEAFMAMNLEAKQRGLQFNDKETELITGILTSEMAPADKKKLDMLKMLSKKLAGPR